jgi:hypothetical protein
MSLGLESGFRFKGFPDGLALRAASAFSLSRLLRILWQDCYPMGDIRYFGKGDEPPKRSKEQQEREANEAKLSAARAREREAIATLREADVLRKRHELISRDTAMKQASFLFVSIRQRLLALPTQLVRKLDVPDKPRARMIIDASIRECLTELSELPDRVTREQYEDFVAETENGEKRPARRKPSR